MNKHQVTIFALETGDGAFTPMRGTVVYDPEDSASVMIGWLLHDLPRQAARRVRLRRSLRSVQRASRGERRVRQDKPRPRFAHTRVHLHRRTRCRWQCGVAAGSSLDAGFLVSSEDEFVLFEASIVPHPFVEIENTSGLGAKLGITRKDPAAMLPSSDGILVKPAPHGGVADRGHQPALASFPSDIGDTKARERELARRWQLTGQGFDLHHQLWGGKPEGDRGEGVRQCPADVPRKTVFATC